MTTHVLMWGLLLLIASAAASAGLIVLLRPLLERYALARPNARSSHDKPIAQGGGIAVVGVTLLLSLVAYLVDPALGKVALVQFTPVAIAAVLLAMVGMVDDIRTLGALPRLLIQTLAVAMVVLTLPNEARVAPILPFFLERALLLIAGVWFVNLVNFMDGIDWMTAAEVVPVTAALIMLGLHSALPAYAIVVVIALLGTTLGFAWFNMPVARLFLGDVGSLPIGLLLGWLLLLLAAEGHVAAALLLPLYYLCDATFTLARRAYAADKVWQAHRSHFYQRAIDGGFSVREVVMQVFALNVVLGAMAIGIVMRPATVTTISAVVVGTLLVAGLLYRFERGKRTA